jgi:alcohol dehydrogenase
VRAITFDEKLAYTETYPDPTPAEGECIVKVHLAGICATDHEITRGYMNFQGIPGHEMVGTVVHGSPNWRGKRVACEINCVCGRCDMCLAGLSNHCRNRTVLGIAGRNGCFADLVAVPERNLHQVPDTITDEAAVFIEPLAAAYQVIKQVPIERRMSVAVVGSGRLGLLVAQVLAHTGCRLEVFGRNPHTLLFCEKKRIQGTTIDDMRPKSDRDVVVECTGSPQGLRIALALARPRGTIVLKSTHAKDAPVNLTPAVVNEITIVGSRCGPFPEAIAALARRDVEVSSMVARAYRLNRGLEAFEASADPNNIKVLLRIQPR